MSLTVLEGLSSLRSPVYDGISIAINKAVGDFMKSKRKNKNNSSLMISGALGLTVLVTFVANEMILNQSDKTIISDGRSPASIVVESIRSGTLEAERKLASTLSEMKTRTLASLGKDANPFDQFRFGILEGKYAFTIEDEKIKDVSFVDTPNSEGAPTRVTDRIEFLRNHSQILNIKSKIEKTATDIKGRKIIETYTAVLADSNKKVTVQVEVDELDRLYHINLL